MASAVYALLLRAAVGSIGSETADLASLSVGSETNTQLILCSDWPERTIGSQLRHGGPAHCTCGPGQTKEHIGADGDWGWHCTSYNAPATSCEFDAMCSHCKTQGWWPVCGVDGHTYSSACRAKCKCVSVASEGACDGWGGGNTKVPSSSPAAAGIHAAQPMASRPGISARVDITRADGTHTMYHSRPPSREPAVVDYLEAATTATTKLQQMELIREHAAKSSAQSSPPPSPDDEATIPTHLSEWHDPEGATATASDFDVDESCDSENGVCYEQPSVAGKQGSDHSIHAEPTADASQKQTRKASYGKSPQTSAYSSDARDYAADLKKRPKTLKQDL